MSDEVCTRLRYLKSEVEKWWEDDEHRVAMAVACLKGAGDSLEEMLDLVAELAVNDPSYPSEKEVRDRLDRIAELMQESFDDVRAAYYYHRTAADEWSFRLKVLRSSISEMLEKLGCKES